MENDFEKSKVTPQDQFFDGLSLLKQIPLDRDLTDEELKKYHRGVSLLHQSLNRNLNLFRTLCIETGDLLNEIKKAAGDRPNSSLWVKLAEINVVLEKLKVRESVQNQIESKAVPPDGPELEKIILDYLEDMNAKKE